MNTFFLAAKKITQLYIGEGFIKGEEVEIIAAAKYHENIHIYIT